MAPVAADAGVTRFKCQLSSAGDSMTMEFVYDDITGKAHVVGNAGLSDVAPYVGQWAITFLEFLPTGAVQSTTIEVKTGAVVHSRHTLMPNLFPSQMRGTCSRS